MNPSHKRKILPSFSQHFSSNRFCGRRKLDGLMVSLLFLYWCAAAAAAVCRVPEIPEGRGDGSRKLEQSCGGPGYNRVDAAAAAYWQPWCARTGLAELVGRATVVPPILAHRSFLNHRVHPTRRMLLLASGSAPRGAPGGGSLLSRGSWGQKLRASWRPTRCCAGLERDVAVPWGTADRRCESAAAWPAVWDRERRLRLFHSVCSCTYEGRVLLVEFMCVYLCVIFLRFGAHVWVCGGLGVAPACVLPVSSYWKLGVSRLAGQGGRWVISQTMSSHSQRRRWWDRSRCHLVSRLQQQ